MTFKKPRTRIKKIRKRNKKTRIRAKNKYLGIKKYI